MLRFAFWSDAETAPKDQAVRVALWYRRVVAEGHTPRLLTARDAHRSSAYKREIKKGIVFDAEIPYFALRAKKGIFLDVLCP